MTDLCHAHVAQPVLRRTKPLYLYLKTTELLRSNQENHSLLAFGVIRVNGL
jgi:hypothetical protein